MEVWHLGGKLNRQFCSKHVADDYSRNDLFRYELYVEKKAFLSSKVIHDVSH
jgi:hypothetical protein